MNIKTIIRQSKAAPDEKKTILEYIDSLESRLRLSETEKSKLEENIKKSIVANTVLEDSLSAAHGAIDQLSSRIEAMDSQLSTLEQRRALVERDLESIPQSIRDLSKKD